MYVRRSLVLLLALILILPFWAFQQANRPETATSQGFSLSDLQLYEVRRGTVALTVTAIGSIEADNQVQLSFLTAGRVADIFVRRDDYVLAGDLLIRLENDQQRILYEQALANVERAELQYQDLLVVDEDNIRLGELAIESARGAYYSALNAVSQGDIQAAQLRYQQALQQAEALKIERDNVGGQFGGESLPYQQANARYGEATFQAEIARLQIESLRTAIYPQASAALARITEAEAQLAQIQAGASPAQLDSAQFGIQQAENQLEQAEVAYQRTSLSAPFAGVITALNVEQGSLVAPSLTVIELTNLYPLGLTVQVDEIDIGLVAVGQLVRVELDALPDLQFPARVISIAPLGTPSGGIVSYDVEIALEGQDERVRVGMTAEATIIIQEAENVLSVPNLYIRRDRLTGDAFVNVLRQAGTTATIEEIQVELGIQGRENSAVISGLEQGDLVAIDLSGRGLNILGGSQ